MLIYLFLELFRWFDFTNYWDNLDFTKHAWIQNPFIDKKKNEDLNWPVVRKKIFFSLQEKHYRENYTFFQKEILGLV